MNDNYDTTIISPFQVGRLLDFLQQNTQGPADGFSLLCVGLTKVREINMISEGIDMPWEEFLEEVKVALNSIKASTGARQ